MRQVVPSLTLPPTFRLDLSGRQLTDANARCIWHQSCACIKFLNLSNNLLERIPPRLKFLQSLEELDVSKNPGLCQLPPRVVLPKLERLNLSHNHALSDVAAAVAWLCGPDGALQWLDLQHTSLDTPPTGVIDRGGQAVRQYFVDLHRARETCWSQTVLIVGQEQAGKSALCRALLGQKCVDRPQPAEMSTVGIDTMYWRASVALEPSTDRFGNG